MRIGDAVEAVFHMAGIVTHETRIAARGDYHIVPTETACHENRHVDAAAARQREMFLAAIVLVGDRDRGMRTCGVFQAKENDFACNFRLNPDFDIGRCG